MKTNIQKRMTSEHQNLCQMIRLTESILPILSGQLQQYKIKFSSRICSLFLSSILLLGVSTTGLAQNTPGYNTKIPEYIMTPDKVETRIGTLEFFDGIPTKETAALLYDNLDFLRGVETFLNGIPATSLEGIRLGMVNLGLKNSNQALIFDQLMDSNPLFLTGNTSTVYLSIILDLKKDGPTVVEILRESAREQ